MRKTILIFMILSFLLVSSAFASEYLLICLKEKEQIDYRKCDPTNPSFKVWTCEEGSGTCRHCVKLTDSGKFCPASSNKCNRIKGGCTDLFDPEIDSTPPELTVNSPKQEEVFSSKSVILNLNASESVTLSYIDNYGASSEKRICRGCSYYNDELSFKEGLNNITFIATDSTGLTDSVDVSFTIDSKAPKIKKTEPKKGFTNGFFYVQIEEENPKLALLRYGNNLTGYRNKSFNKNDCIYNKGKYDCLVYANLSDYYLQKIDYWFEVTDIADSYAESKKITLDADNKKPAIDKIGLTQDKKYIMFNISADEPNFQEILYRDNGDSKPKFKSLCKKLKNGICIAKKSFKAGVHNLDIMIIDKAGNFEIYPITFTING